MSVTASVGCIARLKRGPPLAHRRKATGVETVDVALCVLQGTTFDCIVTDLTLPGEIAIDGGFSQSRAFVAEIERVFRYRMLYDVVRGLDGFRAGR